MNNATMGYRAHPPAKSRVRIGRKTLPGTLEWPDDPVGIVVFVHGCGSSRNSLRNQFAASVLRYHGLGTLQFDLLTETEAGDRRKVFDTQLLASRVMDAVDFLTRFPDLPNVPLCLFGASTGTAAALVAAAFAPQRVQAVVSRGGRPDLAQAHLLQVQAPTLLIVGGEDREVLGLNRLALEALLCEKRLEVVPGATHLFEEPGKLDAAIQLASAWFHAHLARQPAAATA